MKDMSTYMIENLDRVELYKETCEVFLDYPTIGGEDIKDYIGKVMMNILNANTYVWLGHVLRAEESYLLKIVVVEYIKNKAEGGYPAGSILMDSPHHRTAEELLALVQDRETWRLHVKNIVE